VRFACHGECPRNRFILTPDGEPGLNYLCAGYKLFFHHIGPAMQTMAGLLRHGRWADEIMQLYATLDSSPAPAAHIAEVGVPTHRQSIGRGVPLP
jgi:uncharacterized protein